MPVDFQMQRQELRDVLSTVRQQGAEFARDFAQWYDRLVRSGQDATYGNTVLSANLPAFTSSLAGLLASPAGTAQVFERTLQQAVIAYWTGATLALATPPPGTGPVTANVVSSPGTFDFSLPQNSESEEPFVDAVIQAIRRHFSTLSGITTSLTPSPTGPVPVTYPWTGYI
jgi:hypothetical protein